MVSTNHDGTVKGPYQDVKKDKSSAVQRSQQYTQQRSQSKTDKNGAWGPIYKNKQNFINMHIC